MSHTSLYSPVTITAIHQEAAGVKTITLTYADGSPIPYNPGQFITFVFEHHGREERRSFSISSSPALNEPFTITVKRVDNGAYSRLLNDRAAVGDILYTTGAGGLFTIPENISAYKQVFLFAAGIGITPIFSIVKTLLHTAPQMHIVLVYSNRSREDVVFYNELNELVTRYHERFKVEWLFSNAFNLSRARLNKALIPVLLAEYSLVPKADILCYICGPYNYMRMVTWTLEEQGIKEARIKKENFNTDERAVVKTEPADKEPHYVTIQHNGSSSTFLCTYPDTILQAAKKNNVILPYSCETGKCGSCAALCIKGRVWLSYNEVLTDTELKAGSTLTCTGYPVGGDVVISV